VELDITTVDSGLKTKIICMPCDIKDGFDTIDNKCMYKLIKEGEEKLIRLLDGFKETHDYYIKSKELVKDVGLFDEHNRHTIELMRIYAETKVKLMHIQNTCDDISNDVNHIESSKRDVSEALISINKMCSKEWHKTMFQLCDQVRKGECVLNHIKIENNPNPYEDILMNIEKQQDVYLEKLLYEVALDSVWNRKIRIHYTEFRTHINKVKELLDSIKCGIECVERILNLQKIICGRIDGGLRKTL
jgi:hypothetical protein